MKYIFIIILSVSSCNHLIAQSTKTILESNEFENDTVIVFRKTFYKTAKTNSWFDKISKTHNKNLQKQDSITSIVSKNYQRIDSIKLKYQFKSDSLQKLGLPQSEYTHKLDSLKQLANVHKLKEWQGKQDQDQNKLNESIQTPENKVNEKLHQLSSQANGEGNLPSDINLPDLKGHKLKSNLSLNSKITTPTLPKLNNPLGKHLSKITAKLSSCLKFTRFNKSGKLESIKGLYKIRKGITLPNKLPGYSAKTPSFKYGDLEKAVEQELQSKLPGSQINPFEEQAQAVKALQNKAKTVDSKDAYKKQMIAKAKEIVLKQVATQQAKLAESVAKVSEYQRKGSTILGKVKGLPKQETQTKKQVPFIEHLLPGFTFQIQKTNLVFIDFTPSIRYKINHLFSVGAGWNERLVLDGDQKLLSIHRMYGLRSFGEMSILKGFALRLDVERMNAFVPLSRQKIDIGERKWVWIYMAGVKKEFSFVGKVTGNVQFMYNLYDPHNNSPYVKRLNVRFGFELPLKEKKKK